MFPKDILLSPVVIFKRESIPIAKLFEVSDILLGLLPIIIELFPIKTMSVIATREDWFNQSSDGETSLVSKHGWRTT